jgi:AraC-like DNA-binding protein
MDVVNEFVRGVPHPRLHPFVPDYTGYRLSGFAPGVHVGLPSRSLTFIVAFDAPLNVAGASATRDRYWAMLAGLHSRPALVRHDGRQHGVQIGVTPAGAAALFGTPAGELASQVVHLDSVVPDVSSEIVERLSAAASWRARWAVLDDILLRCLSAGFAADPVLAHAWSRLAASDGSISIGELAAEVGWNRQHFSRRFTKTFGLSPKVMSRVMRFERSQQMLKLPTHPSLASVAAVCGYADQAHMTREWNEFAGSPPTVWMRDEQLPFVQDT